MKIISGFLGGRILKTSEGKGYRPAMGKVREALFSILESQGILWGATRVLDVYAGTGSLAFEAISRGAKNAVFIEMSSTAVDCLNYNIDNLGIREECKIWKSDASKILSRPSSESFGLIFVDPPYGEKRFLPTLQNIIDNNWLDDRAYFVAEVEAGLKFPSAFDGLELIADRTYGQTRILIWRNVSVGKETARLEEIAEETLDDTFTQIKLI